MIKKFGRMSIAHQALSVLMALLLAMCGLLYFWATSNAMDAELAHTRTVADMTESFRTLSAKHGGFYLRRPASQDIATVGRYLASVEVESRNAAGENVTETFHQKNPFLALADFSEVVAESPAAAKFRIVSDNYMNPANMPDMFEMTALASLRQENKGEFFEVVNGKLRYARPITATAACLKCHGDAEAAPGPVRAMYRPPQGGAKRAGGYGYREGELVGLTSVTVPHKTPWQMLASQSTAFWTSSGLLLGLMVLAMAMVIRGIVIPIRRQTEYATRLATTENPAAVPAPAVQPLAHTSGNELHQQAHALMAVHESLSTVHGLVTVSGELR